MRVIAGTLRGRRLIGPTGQKTRPITDRAKQSLFDILAPRIEGARVYDLFAGTGSMGIECLSRGAEHAMFFEFGKAATDALRANLTALELDARSTIVRGDLFAWFERTDAPLEGVDLAFLDPPYGYVPDAPGRLRRLAERLAAHLADDSIVVFRHDARDKLELPSLKRYDQRQYGDMMIELLRPTR